MRSYKTGFTGYGISGRIRCVLDLERDTINFRKNGAEPMDVSTRGALKGRGVTSGWNIQKKCKM